MSNQLGQFPVFIVAGGIGALANLSSRVLLDFFLSYVVAIVVAYIIGMITTFTLSKYFVFEKTANSILNEALKFSLVNIAALLIVITVSIVLSTIIFPAVNFSFYPEDVAHVIGVFSTAITSYFAHKYYTFKGKNDTKHYKKSH